MAGQNGPLWASCGHRLLLAIWRRLPLAPRRLAIRILFPRFPIGAVAIVRNEAGHILLVHQTYHSEGALWAAPGGWLGRNESPAEAAVRETFEETGLRVVAERVLATSSGPYGEISLAFECRVLGDTGFVPNAEADQIGYFPPTDLPRMSRYTRDLLTGALAALSPEAAPAPHASRPATGTGEGAGSSRGD